jgi:hypothetical protein
VDWGALDVDKPLQNICGASDAATILEFLHLPIRTFGNQ